MKHLVQKQMCSCLVECKGVQMSEQHVVQAYYSQIIIMWHTAITHHSLPIYICSWLESSSSQTTAFTVCYTGNSPSSLLPLFALKLLLIVKFATNTFPSQFPCLWDSFEHLSISYFTLFIHAMKCNDSCRPIINEIK